MTSVIYDLEGYTSIQIPHWSAESSTALLENGPFQNQEGLKKNNPNWNVHIHMVKDSQRPNSFKTLPFHIANKRLVHHIKTLKSIAPQNNGTGKIAKVATDPRL